MARDWTRDGWLEIWGGEFGRGEIWGYCEFSEDREFIVCFLISLISLNSLFGAAMDCGSCTYYLGIENDTHGYRALLIGEY